MLSAVLTYHVLHRSNQFREDLRAAKNLLPGLRISWFWNLVILDWWLIRSSSQLSAESWDGWLLESFYWQLLIAHCCNTVSCEVHVGTEISGGKIIIAYLSNSQQENRWEHERSSKTGYVTIWEDWTDSWIREKDLYCIYAAQQKDSEGSRSVHTRNCVWLKIWTLCS